MVSVLSGSCILVGRAFVSSVGLIVSRLPSFGRAGWSRLAQGFEIGGKMGYRCPNCDSKEFLQVNPVWQEWKIDEMGRRVSTTQNCITAVEGFRAEQVYCAKCGAAADLVSGEVSRSPQPKPYWQTIVCYLDESGWLENHRCEHEVWVVAETISWIYGVPVGKVKGDLHRFYRMND